MTPICVGADRGVAIWHGHMMHDMVVMYDHFQGTEMANSSCEALLKAAPQNLLSKLPAASELYL